jgi:hypothetical protein
MTNADAMRRGDHAKRLIEDELLNEAINTIEKEILDQWEACPVRDVDGRELLWKYFKTARKFRGILEGVLQNGKVASFREKQSIADKAVNIFKRTG